MTALITGSLETGSEILQLYMSIHEELVKMLLIINWESEISQKPMSKIDIDPCNISDKY